MTNRGNRARARTLALSGVNEKTRRSSAVAMAKGGMRNGRIPDLISHLSMVTRVGDDAADGSGDGGGDAGGDGGGG